MGVNKALRWQYQQLNLYFCKLSLTSLVFASLYVASESMGMTVAAQMLNAEVPTTRVEIGRKQTAVNNLLAAAQVRNQGTSISLNNKTIPVAWRQWRINSTQVRTGISDTGLMQTIGVELLNTNKLSQQPVQWFSEAGKTPLLLSVRLQNGYRYLDITDLAKRFGWQIQADGNTLRILTQTAQVSNIRQGQQPEGERIVVDLDRPAPWRLVAQAKETVITIDASTNAEILQRFNPPPPVEQPINPENTLPQPTLEPDSNSKQLSVPSPNNQSVSPIVESSQQQTIIRIPVATGWRTKVITLPNPNRLVIDIAPDAFVERDIFWAPGVRWRQQLVSNGTDRFPVVWLELNLRQRGLTLKPILNTANGLVGIAPLVKFAPTSQAAAAINGGYFNRNQQLPLGAIRLNSRWLSSPILNRGAIAWDNKGNVRMARLSIQETLLTQTQARLPVASFNSGYVQAGIARYTRDWGATYTTLTNNEILVVVQNNQITSQVNGELAGKTSVPIPANGYLLSIRSNPEAINLLTVGSRLNLESISNPPEFNRYPHIIAAGPLLVENQQIVLDAKAEQFKDAFIREKAARSAIGTTASGRLIIVAVHNRVNGAGPTLTEIAQLMQQMGAVNALNLDGGSSTSLYLGGQLVNRSPATAARVHNGIGIFLQSNR